MIFTKTSSKCHRHRLDRIPSTRRFRISAANNGPKRFHQNRTVSWLISIPRSCSRSLTFRRDRGNRTWSITARRMISGLVLKYLKGLGLLIRQRQAHALPGSSHVGLTEPTGEFGSILALENSSVTRPDHRDLGLISSAALAHAIPQANKTTASASANILLVIGPQSLRSAEDGVAQLSAMTTPFSAAAAQPIHFGHAGHPPAADRIANAMTSSKTTDIAAANRPFSGKAPSCWPP